MSSQAGPQEAVTLKILLIGSSNTGKSSLLLRYTDDDYIGPEEATATIGVDYKIKQITVAARRYKLSIWDTAGQERFRTLTSSYYRGAQGVIIVYDVTARDSFEALPNWFNELETFTSSPDVVKIIVGNKIDKEYTRVVTTEEGKAFAESRGCLFVECSAKKGQGVIGAFDELVNQVSNHHSRVPDSFRAHIQLLHVQIISTPSLWESTSGRRPGDRMPGGAPADHAASASRGNISLTDPGGYVGYGLGVAKENCSC